MANCNSEFDQPQEGAMSAGSHPAFFSFVFCRHSKQKVDGRHRIQSRSLSLECKILSLFGIEINTNRYFKLLSHVQEQFPVLLTFHTVIIPNSTSA
jgi:hypothetical protein